MEVLLYVANVPFGLITFAFARRVSVLKGQLHELQEHRRVFHVSFLHTVVTLPFLVSDPGYISS